MRKNMTSRRKPRSRAPRRRGLTLSQMIKIIGNPPPVRTKRKPPKRRKKISLAQLLSWFVLVLALVSCTAVQATAPVWIGKANADTPARLACYDLMQTHTTRRALFFEPDYCFIDEFNGQFQLYRTGGS